MKSSKLNFVFILTFAFALLVAGHSNGGSIPDLWAETGQMSLSGSCGEQLFSAAAGSAAQELNRAAHVVSFSRKHLLDNIYEYTAVLQVGPGVFDKIGIHRVVKERIPWLPVSTKHAVLMLHGDTSNFESSFLGSTLSGAVPRDQSAAIYLAANNIDVWGMDRRVTFVTDGTTDFSFMKSWNTALHLQDTRLVIKIARTARLLTECGSDKLILLGHSRGAQVTYAYANVETQLPPHARDIKGIIPIDLAYKAEPGTPEQQAALDRYAAYKTMYDAGVFSTNEGAQSKYIAYLAATAPSGPSPLIPGLTNLQAAYLALSATYLTFAPLSPPVPFYHYNAGLFDEYGIPTGLQFTKPEYVMDIELLAPSFVTVAEQLDGEALMSGVENTPYDDHLAEITIPVMYVGAAGGFGASGLYTPTLLGSSDNTPLIVRLYPEGYEALDYGHADLLWADNALPLVWTPVRDWIKSH